MKRSVIVIALMAIFICANAQNDGIKSINIGFAPVGYIHENIRLGGEKYRYDYKSYYNINLGYEKQLGGVVSLTEIKYAAAKFDKYDLKGVSAYFNPLQQEDIYSVSVTAYAGKTINPNKRIQFPVYIGIGGEYINGGPFHNIIFDLAAKARVKFYVSNKIGIFAGGTGRIGWGSKSAGKSSGSKKDYYTIQNSQWSVDAGLIFSLN